MPSGSNPLVGSSSSNTAGSPNNAAAMPNRCRIPRENVLIRRFRGGRDAGLLQHLVDATRPECRC